MKKAIVGFGGHAREVLAQMGENLVCFVSDELCDENTLPLSQFRSDEYEILVAIADPLTRQKIVDSLPKETKYFNFIHSTCLIGAGVNFGVGTFIGAYSILTTDIKIGNHCILNRMNHIGHDCGIGDFFTMMPGSIISGNCMIGSRVYFGTNASVKQKINICDDVTVGLNSGVVKNILAPGVYAGLPVEKIK